MKVAAKGKSVVYFFESAGLVKIGWTRNLQARIDALAVFSPLPSVLLGYGEGPKTREGYLHERFWADHSHGEWFRPSEELRGVIASAIAGDAEWNALPTNCPFQQRIRYAANRRRRKAIAVAIEQM